jgi:hypothetical protein
MVGRVRFVKLNSDENAAPAFRFTVTTDKTLQPGICD